MHKRPLIICTWLGIIILAVFLRFNDLEQRPMHADEATGARILSNRLEANSYQFDPKHFHGPLLSITAEPIAQLAGETSWQRLSKHSLRIGPAIAGILLVLTPLLWQRRIGAIAALTAGMLLATSPIIVYYNRMYIHESLLALLAMLALATGYQLLEKPKRGSGLMTGLFIGLMFATKETAAISVIAWVVASFVYLFAPITDRPPLSARLQIYLKPFIYLGLATAVSAAFFYSNGFKSAQGVIDAIRTYFIYETTAGHEKAWSYYFELLLWPKHRLGMWWSEASVLLLGIASVGALWKYRDTSQKTGRFLFAATFTHILIYSLISYKTPWLMLVPWAHGCLLVGFLTQKLPQAKRATRIFLTLLLIASFSIQTRQCLLANGLYASDARNPYAYVPTSKNVEALEVWLDELIEQNPSITRSTIAVVGNEYWPLPWYLKAFETIGYWPEIETMHRDFPLVFAMPGQAQRTAAQLQDTHTALPRSLRADVPVVLYLRNDIWQQWTKEPAL